ncbi:50S ribosomal protein L30e [uncultured archaeon]|nr:50S ribosomal protein L30e [uncultured archaeon]
MARKKAAAETAVSALAKAIRQCVDSGKVEFGTNVGVKSSLSGRAKLVVISSNCPSQVKDDVVRFCKLSSVPCITYEGTSLELGTIAGRPHPVAILTVYDPGNSGLLELSKQ